MKRVRSTAPFVRRKYHTLLSAARFHLGGHLAEVFRSSDRLSPNALCRCLRIKRERRWRVTTTGGYPVTMTLGTFHDEFSARKRDVAPRWCPIRTFHTIFFISLSLFLPPPTPSLKGFSHHFKEVLYDHVFALYRHGFKISIGALFFSLKHFFCHLRILSFDFYEYGATCWWLQIYDDDMMSESSFNSFRNFLRLRGWKWVRDIRQQPEELFRPSPPPWKAHFYDTAQRKFTKVVHKMPWKRVEGFELN